MPLNGLRPDPTPTIDELAHLLNEFRNVADPNKRQWKAQFFWKKRMLAKDPDLFTHRFSNRKTFKAYQNSDLWKEIRKRVLQSADFKCAGCIGRATEVHHRDYRPSVMDGSDITLLVPLCRRCQLTIRADDSPFGEDWTRMEFRLAQMVAAEDRRLALLAIVPLVR